LVSGLATSGLGYIYEDAFGRISYADAVHRSQYLSANGYVDLTANQARAAGLRIETRAGDVRNQITIQYKNSQQKKVPATQFQLPLTATLVKSSRRRLNMTMTQMNFRQIFI
jgi:hypothetical protein